MEFGGQEIKNDDVLWSTLVLECAYKLHDSLDQKPQGNALGDSDGQNSSMILQGEPLGIDVLQIPRDERSALGHVSQTLRAAGNLLLPRPVLLPTR